MSDKGPITFITDLSQKRNRWKGLAFAWRSVAISAIRPCSVCGAPAAWQGPEPDVLWCQAHWEGAPSDAAGKATKLPWHSALQRAIDLETQLEGDA